MFSSLERALESWHNAKVFLEYALAISNDALHVVIGLGAWLTLAMVTRRPISSAVPLFLLLAGALLNEAGDVWSDPWVERARQYGEGAKDVLLSILGPVVLMLTHRYCPGLYRQSGNPS